MSDILFKKAQEHFQGTYNRPSSLASFAPGRVNIIGGHVDYNDGFVLPVALDQRIYTLAAPRSDNMVHAKSMQISGEITFDIHNPAPSGEWGDAVKGVIALLKEDGADITGVDLLFAGDVPLEAGLSSSAAFTVSAALCLSHLYGAPLKEMDLALFAQRVENQFMGVNCGILDQSASACCQKGHALLLDCRSLEYRHIPIHGDFSIVVCHTGVTRSLASSKYNQRRDECAQGLKILHQKHSGIASYRDITIDLLKENKNDLGDVIFRRLRHVVNENERVLKACEALDNGDPETLGALITKSHQSLRDDYEVSCEELDTMTSLALDQPGCLGARLVGAGFGGCAIALVQPQFVENFLVKIPPVYQNLTKKTGRLFQVKPGQGAALSL